MSTAHIATNLLNNKQLLELKEERREEVQREREREREYGFFKTRI